MSGAENTQSYMRTPPILDTDVPSNEQYFNDVPGYSGHKVGKGNRRRYASSHLGIIAMEQAPVGHGQTSQGVWIAHLTNDQTGTVGNRLRLAFHPHSATSSGLSARWTHYDEVIASNPAPPDGVSAYNRRVFVSLAGQRLGNYLYAFTWAAQTLSTGVTSGRFKALKYGPNGMSVLVDQIITSSSGNLNGPSVPLLGLDMPWDFGSNPASGYTETFVSDDAKPFVWHTSGNLSTMPCTVVGFRENGSGSPGSRTVNSDSTTSWTGQVGAYAQVYRVATTKQTFGPYLVFPWRSGHYDPPELWFLVQIGAYGSTFDAYRAKWGPGHYKRDDTIVVADDSDFMNKSRRFPLLNPTGLAFDHNWYQAKNKVGRIGPFPGANIDNGADDHPPGGMMTNPMFKFMRDPNKIGQIHIVLLDADQPPPTAEGGSVTT